MAQGLEVISSVHRIVSDEGWLDDARKYAVEDAKQAGYGRVNITDGDDGPLYLIRRDELEQIVAPRTHIPENVAAMLRDATPETFDSEIEVATTGVTYTQPKAGEVYGLLIVKIVQDERLIRETAKILARAT